MKSSNSHDFIFHLALIVAILATFACSQDNGSPPPQPSIAGLPNGFSLKPMSGDNVVRISVNGANCAQSYINKPCVSVTVCAPNDQSNCEQVNNILLDTGSVGLRVFKSSLNASLQSALPSIKIGNQPLAECVQFGDGSSDWGSVNRADVILANERANSIAMQIIDSEFASIPSTCAGAEVDPQRAGFNGILGVGMFIQDCGSKCAATDTNNIYFGCPPTGCNGTAVPLRNQVQNPVAALPRDNNGVIIELPAVPLGGVQSIDGYLILGIGTAANNIPQGVLPFAVNSTTSGYVANFNGQIYPSFLDSGSNALYFPAPPSLLIDCGSIDPATNGFYCPPTPTNLSAVTFSTVNSRTAKVPFIIGNALSFNSNNHVFAEIGANLSIGGAQVFDWGLPFFLGRNVYFGFESHSSALASGTYWAF